MAAFAQLGRASATSATLHFASDIVAQTVQNATVDPSGGPREYWERLSWSRVAKFTVVGACAHGPYFLHAYRWLDRVVGQSTTTSRVILKTLVGQGTIFPAYLVVFFSLRTVLDGGGLAEIKDRMSQQYLSTYAAGCIVWPPANAFFFRFVPIQHRVLGANIVGLGWQAFMSHQAAAHVKSRSSTGHVADSSNL